MNPSQPSTPPGPLRALLLRLSTAERKAVAEVAEIKATQTAADAVAALRGFTADVVVTDIGTSDRETKAFLEVLRPPRWSPRPGLPVICLLAESSPDRVRALVRAGVDHVMVKPISAAALVELAASLRDEPVEQIQVADYGGPDRRRLPGGAHTGPDRRKG